MIYIKVMLKMLNGCGSKTDLVCYMSTTTVLGALNQLIRVFNSPFLVKQQA